MNPNPQNIAPPRILSPSFFYLCHPEYLLSPRIFYPAVIILLSLCPQSIYYRPQYLSLFPQNFYYRPEFLSLPRIFIIAQNFCPCPEFLSLGQNFLSPLSAVNLKQIVFHSQRLYPGDSILSNQPKPELFGSLKLCCSIKICIDTEWQCTINTEAYDTGF